MRGELHPQRLGDFFTLLNLLNAFPLFLNSFMSIKTILPLLGYGSWFGTY